MTSRPVTIGLVCACLYAVVLGAGATAQDASPAVVSVTASASPAPPAPSVTAVETVVEPSVTPAQPAASPAPAETTTPLVPAPAPTETPASAPTTTIAPSLGVDETPRVKRKRRTGHRAEGVAGLDCDTRQLEGSTSSSTSACEKVGEEGSDDDEKERPRQQGAVSAPASADPGYSLAMPGSAAIGVPNFFIERFRIPPFLLPIYQAAGIQYGIRWEVLAAINEIETDYGRNLNISSAGALGWMQFMPPTWAAYGVDANGDGQKDPFNPVDAIFAAARYLRAAGADKDLSRAIFAYNHADWYVDSVLMRARVIGGLPADLVGSLTGLTQGRFPVGARATYSGDLGRSGRTRRVEVGENAAYVVESAQHRRSIQIHSRAGAAVVAVNDGVITRLGHSRRRGRFVELEDPYGNSYLYSGLARVARTYPSPKVRKAGKRALRREREAPPRRDAAPTSEASASSRADIRPVADPPSTRRPSSRPRTARPAKERLFAHPDRPSARPAGGAEQRGPLPAGADPMVLDGRRLDPRHFTPKPLRKGARVSAGTVLGRLGRLGRDPDLAPPARAAFLRFEIRPAGRGAPQIDPKPILDGWKLLESTAIYRSKQRNPFAADAEAPSIGQIMLMSKAALQRHVLRNPNIVLYACGRQDIRTGQVDRRVLATLEFLAASGLKPTVTSLRCGHGYYTASGNVSHHSSGSAVDIAAVNGIVISPATQGEGSITDLAIQRLLTLQGTMRPAQIISLMTFEGAANTFAMGDHDDHIHVGFRPVYGVNSKAARRMGAVLKPDQWIELIDRISSIDNPVVREQPSRFSVAVTKPASKAHQGE